MLFRSMGMSEFIEPVVADGNKLLLEKANASNIEREIVCEEQVTAPVEEGQELGYVLISSNGEQTARVSIVAPAAVAKMGFGSIFKKLLVGMFMG